MAHGEIHGIQVGHHFDSRQALCDAGVHRMTQNGIAGYGGNQPAESIVLSGGYQDDIDDGDEILYTGEGGRDPASGRQIRDQQLTKGNLGLVRACEQGFPIRVCRKTTSRYRYDGLYHHDGLYRYDGLYSIEDHWHEDGQDGYRIYRFRLKRDASTSQPAPTPTLQAPAGTLQPGVVKQTTLRRIRETAVAKHVKDVHGNQCQVCGVALLLPGGTYSEAAHIRALGKPHLGPDTVDNILCLCPNHHVLFDRGSIWIDDNLRVQPAGTPLIAPHLNPLDIEHVRYHRNSRAPS